ncbi:MAG: hypothetical protein ACXQTD_06005 [Candidatus Syntropharchaeia archaeon]
MPGGKVPKWIEKYRELIEKGEITIDEILRRENENRKKKICGATVSRAINAMGFSVTEFKKGKKPGKIEKKKEIKKIEKKEEIEKEEETTAIEEISPKTKKVFLEEKDIWEKNLGKSFSNDSFVGILLALAKLAEHGETIQRQ